MKDFEKFDNYVLEFGKWLKNVKGQKERTISSRISNIKTVGQHYDVLKEFVADECQNLLEELSFSKADIEPKTNIVINGDYYNGLATYRQSVKLFVAFLNDIKYTSSVVVGNKSARFIGNFDDFKRYIGPKCRNDVNIFCKGERNKHKGICEWCGGEHELQSAHIKERPVIIKEILDSDYRIAEDWYDVNIDEFLLKFRAAHMPIEEHIFFLCKTCHDKLDKEHSISVEDIMNKRKGR